MGDDSIDMAYLVTPRLALLAGKYSAMGPERVGRRKLSNPTEGFGINPYGRGLHSSTSQLNLRRFWSLMPQLPSTSQLNLRRFCR